MKKFLLLFLLPLYASQPCGRFLIEGESLYLKPCTDNLAFAIVDNREVLNRPSEDWGYAARVGYTDECSAVYVTWSRLTTSNEQAAANLTSRVEFDWRNLDADLALCLLDHSCPIVAQLIGGVRYTRVEFQRRISDGLREQSINWGVGPHVGVYGSCCLGCGFGLFGRCDVALLVGRTRAKQNALEVERNCQLYPTIGIRVGGDYVRCIGQGSVLRIAGGYQITRIFSAIQRIDRNNLLHETISPLDLTGFFISVELKI